MMKKTVGKLYLWNRTRKYRYFESEVGFDSKTTVQDVGFMNEVHDSPCQNYLKKHYPYPWNITALGIEGRDVFCLNLPLVHVVCMTA